MAASHPTRRPIAAPIAPLLVRRAACWVPLFALCGTIPALAATGGTVHFHHPSILGTSLDLDVTTPDPHNADAAHRAALDEVQRLSRLLSTYDPASELSRVNATRDPVHVSPEVIAVLRAYEGWTARTGGAYSADVGAIAALWTEAERTGHPPTAAQLAAAVAAQRTALWTIDAAAGTVQRTSDRPINVDSLGKGFIVSHAADRGMAAAPGIKGLLLNIGGDIAALGVAQVDRKVRWPVVIADPLHPADNADPIVELKLSGQSVATSAHYERGYTVAGARYSHILDPRRGVPIDYALSDKGRKRLVLSATVVAPDNATANALATTLCVLSAEQGLALVRETAGTECLLILTNGTRLRSAGFRKYEVPRADRFEQSDAADVDAAAWPAGYEVTIDLHAKPVEARPSERPYIAVWIEDDQQQHVATLAVWGNDSRWLPDLAWWKYGRANVALVKAVTRATRSAGKYSFVWDGRDQLGRAVPQGRYSVCVEVAYDHGGRIWRRAPIDCLAAPAESTIEASEVFDAVPLRYGPHTPRAEAAR